eukprot:497545_1
MQLNKQPYLIPKRLSIPAGNAPNKTEPMDDARASLNCIEQPTPSEEQVWITLLSGSIAATVATISKQPIARVKFLRQVSEASTKIEQISLWRLYGDLIREEGLLIGSFRGSTAACFRNIPHSMITYSLYPKFQRLLDKHIHTTHLNKAFAGSLASMNAHLITHPLDTVRVRIAVQYQTIEYRSIQDTFRLIYGTEGTHGFYRGLSVTLFGAIFRAGVGFGVYESLKSDGMRQWDSSHHPLIGRLSIGFIAGTMATTIAYPFDTIRRRQQVFGRTRNVVSTNLMQTIGGNIQNHFRAANMVQYIVRYEGIRGLYKGLLLAMIKSPLAASISLTTNDYVKGSLGWKS